MYAIRMTEFGKMFIRAIDGLLTDNKSAAKLFETVDQAKEYAKEWRVKSQVEDKHNLKLCIVEVETKLVIKKVGKEIEEV